MRSTRGSIRPRAPGTDPPLSFAQQRLWFLDQIESTPTAYNVVVARRLHGELHVAALQRALDELLVRHATLRTTYPIVDGEPVQRIGAPSRFPLTIEDLAGHSSDSTELTRRAGAEARRRFDLVHGPMIRGLLLRSAVDDHVLVLSMHHIVTDAWSEAVLLRELGTLYDAFVRDRPSPLAVLPIDYADVAVWQRDRMTGEHARTQLDYWRAQLDGLAPSLELATDHPRPAVRTGRGGAVAVEIGPELTAALRAVTRRARATMFMTLLAGFQALLARYSGCDDIPVGTAIANRARVETESIVGFFANTLVLRTDVSGSPSFEELIGRVRDVALGAYRHQDLPFERLVKELRPQRTLRATPLFQHMFVFQNTPADDLELRSVRTEAFPLEQETAMFDLTLTLTERADRLAGTLEYATDLFERTTAERIATHFVRLLEAVVAAPDRPIGDADLLDADERQRLLVEWNRTDAEYPEQCIHEIFEQRCAEHPDAVAVVERATSTTLTYRQLDARAERVADRLRHLGVGPEAPVGICLPRSAEAIVAMLGVLKAQAAYVPLDPDHPRARLDLLVDDAGIGVILTDPTGRDRLAGTPAMVVGLGTDEPPTGVPTPAGPVGRPTPEHLAYILYTSGSTGAPKGVMIEHRAVVALLFGVRSVDFGEVRALLHMAPLSFDAATFEIWGALLHGARCVVCPDGRFELDRLAATLDDGVDTAWLTAALFNTVVDADWRILAGLRQLIIGGEALSVEHVATARARLPGLRLVNGYGPTETTTFATTHEIGPVDPGAARIPIGRPIANTRVYVLDDRGRPVPVGVPGELHIAGPGLARGYLGRPDLTAEQFVPDPFGPDGRRYRSGDLVRYRADGEIEFLGRLDAQVKIRGFRVEPGEVEAALGTVPGVTAGAVVARPDSRGAHQLVAFVVVADPASFSAGAVRRALRARLPQYLVPPVIVPLGSLPLTPNGKVDRTALRDLEDVAEPEAVYAPPVTGTERELADVWASVLGVERVGLDDDFFAAGGDSLLAAALIVRTRRRLGRTIPLAALFAAPTIRAVAAALDDEVVDGSTVVALRADGTRPPLFLAHGVSGQLLRYVPLVRLLDAAQPVYGLRPTDADLAGTGRVRIPELARRYVDDILRIRPTGPYLLAGFSFGGILMIEIAHQLEARGHDVALLALLDTEPRESPPPSRAQREATQLRSVARGSESVARYLQRRGRNLAVKARRVPWLVDQWRHRRFGRPLRRRWDDVARVESLRVEPVQRSLQRSLTAYVSPSTRCAPTSFRAGAPDEPSAVRVRDRRDGTHDRYVIDGPGVSHETLMREPHIRLLARALNECLDDALTESAGSTGS